MNRQRFFGLLIAALIVIAGALYLSLARNPSRDTEGLALVPALAHELNTVTAMTIRKGGAAPAVTVHKTGDQWTVAERGDYPADVAKLRKLLLALRDSKIVEEKTANPASFSILGVEDPTQAGAAGAELTIAAQDGPHGVIIGKPVAEGNFARRSGENQTYLVGPAISFETEPRFWIDSRLLDIPATLLQSVEVTSPPGQAYTVHRLNPTDNTFAVDGVPPGRQALDAHALAPAPTMTTTLDAQEVAPVGDIDFRQASQVILTLTDGNIVTLTGVALADKHWLQVKSSKDLALTAKAQGRAFEVAGYRYDALFKPLEQLLVPKESPRKVPGPPTGSPTALRKGSPPTPPKGFPPAPPKGSPPTP